MKKKTRYKKKSKMMRVAPEFEDLVEEISKSLSTELGIKYTKTPNRKISSQVVTRKIAKDIKRKRLNL